MDRELLRASAREMLADRCPPGWVRAALDGGPAEPAGLWEELGRLGWPALGVPEAAGGAGGCFGDQVVLLEELGRRLAPVTYAATACGAVPALLDVGEAGWPWLAGLLEAGGRAALLAGDQRAPGAPEALPLVLSGAEPRLDGVLDAVPGAAVAGVLVIAARDVVFGGVSLACVPAGAPGVRVVRPPSLDPGQALAQVAFEAAPAVEWLVGDRGGAWPAVAAALDRLAVAACAQACGAAEAMLDMTVGYAKARHQFGRPIGSFQAVQHLCVDAAVRVETSKAAVAHAAWCIEEGRPDVPLACSVAKAWVGEQLALAAEDAVQVHGGTGFTWEHDVHLYARRLKATEVLYGSTSWHRQRVFREADL